MSSTPQPTRFQRAVRRVEDMRAWKVIAAVCVAVVLLCGGTVATTAAIMSNASSQTVAAAASTATNSTRDADRLHPRLTAPPATAPLGEVGPGNCVPGDQIAQRDGTADLNKLA